MKAFYPAFYLIALLTLSSFKTISEECAYAGSNISYVKDQTALAIDENDLNKSKFFAYLALKGIHRSQQQLKQCGCEEASKAIRESQEKLILATKEAALADAKKWMRESLQTTVLALNELENHEQHYEGLSDLTETENVAEEQMTNTVTAPLEETKLMHDLIDNRLLDYENSLEKVVNTVNCREALAYATKIADTCEQELLRPGLSESKKYYNLRTLEITKNAVSRLGNCTGKPSK